MKTSKVEDMYEYDDVSYKLQYQVNDYFEIEKLIIKFGERVWDAAQREEQERIIKILVNQFKLKEIAKLFNEEEFLKDAPDDVKKSYEKLKKELNKK